MDRKLDVWAIQKHPKELYTALKNIKTDKNDLILFTNLDCEFQLNGEPLHRPFDTSLYYVGENNDALILLMKDGEATPNQIREYLEKEKLSYHEVSFAKNLKARTLEELDIPYEELKNDKNIPELWFAREEYVLRDALTESKENGITTCNYYPMLEGTLSLEYCGNRTTMMHSVDGRKISGTVTLEDKMILFVNENDSRNLRQEQIMKTLEDLGFTYNILENKDFKPTIERENSIEYKK